MKLGCSANEGGGAAFALMVPLEVFTEYSAGINLLLKTRKIPKVVEGHNQGNWKDGQHYPTASCA